MLNLQQELNVALKWSTVFVVSKGGLYEEIAIGVNECIDTGAF